MPTQGVHIPVKIGTCSLHHSASLARIRNLVEIELKNGGFRKVGFEALGLKPFDPARPHGARTWMQHADDLLGDRTRAADRTSGIQVLPERMQPRRPIHSLMLIK